MRVEHLIHIRMDKNMAVHTRLRAAVTETSGPWFVAVIAVLFEAFMFSYLA